MSETGGDAPITIRKYNNRRLYNTDSASFVTLEDLHAMVRSGIAFVVEEAGSGRDITASVLIQIILDEEGRGHSTLSLDSLRQILRLADAGPHFHAYIEQCINAFVTNRQQIMQRIRFGGGALQHFTGPAPNPEASRSEEIESLKRQLADLQQRLESLTTGQ